jgi:hypothetical protein
MWESREFCDRVMLRKMGPHLDGQRATPTLPLGTATPSPTPTNLLPAPMKLTAALSPRRDAVTLSWSAPRTATILAHRILLYESATQQRPLRDVLGS